MHEYINELTLDTKKAQKFFAKKLAYLISPNELLNKIEEYDEKMVLIDVRDESSFDDEHIPSAINVPYEHLEKYMSKLSKNQIHILYSYNQDCLLSAKAALKLTLNEYPAKILMGGFNIWKSFGFEVE